MRKPIRPVAVGSAELRALWAAWRHFMRDDADIDPLAEAIHKLKRRLDEFEREQGLTRQG